MPYLEIVVVSSQEIPAEERANHRPRTAWSRMTASLITRDELGADYLPNVFIYSSTCFCSAADIFFAYPGILPEPSAMIRSISASPFCCSTAAVTRGTFILLAMAAGGLPAAPWQDWQFFWYSVLPASS